jgi:hypothetical protein
MVLQVYLILGIIAALLISGCKSQVTEADASRLYGSLGPLPDSEDPGLNDPIDPEINDPGLNFKSFIGGEYVKGNGTTHKIKWFLEPVTDQDLGLYSTDIEYSKDGGQTWIILKQSLPSLGATLMEYGWKITSEDGPNYKVRLITTNSYGGRYTKESGALFTVDSVPPVIRDNELNINKSQTTFTSGQGYSKIEVNRNYMAMGFGASDSLSPVTEYCTKFDSASAPSVTDDCWKILANVNLESGKELSITKAPVFMGFVAKSADLRLWVKDAAGNISVQTNVPNKDLTSILYRPLSSPNISYISASRKIDPAVPLTRDDLAANSSTGVFIKWKITPGGNGQLLTTQGIILEYTTDEVNFSSVTSASLSNNDNGGCLQSWEVTASYGCFLWRSPEIPSGYFRIRIKAINDVGLTASSSTAPLNSGFFTNVAGNTDNSAGGSAEKTIFNYTLGGTTEAINAGVLAVTSFGRIYVRDEKHGILSVDPVDGVARVYIKKGRTGDAVQPGEDVPVAQAATLPLRISVDYKDRLLILENSRVRRVDENGVISTLIGVKPGRDGTLATGYGPYADDGVSTGAATQWVKTLDSEGCFATKTTTGIPAQYYKFSLGNSRGAFMTPLPNGDIYFSTADYWHQEVQSAVASDGLSMSAPYFGVYKHKNSAGALVDRVYPIRICGNGRFIDGKQDPYYNLGSDLARRNLRHRGVPGILFNPSNSYVETLSMRVVDYLAGYNLSPQNEPRKPVGVTVNPRTGRGRGANTIYPEGIKSPYYDPAYLQSRKGALYSIGFGFVRKFNVSLNDWESVFANGLGQCKDNTKVPECFTDSIDYFYTDDNVGYFFDRGRIRVAYNNKITTLFGESRKAGDEGSPNSARFNQIEYFGLWGPDRRVAIYDSREFVVREVQQGERIYHSMGNNGEGREEVIDGENVIVPGYFNWSRPPSGFVYDTSNYSSDFPLSGAAFPNAYWDWSTGFAVDPDTGDIYAAADVPPGTSIVGRGLARYYVAGNGLRYGQDILINPTSTVTKNFLSTGSGSCDNTSGIGCSVTSKSKNASNVDTNWAVIPWW